MEGGGGWDVHVHCNTNVVKCVPTHRQILDNHGESVVIQRAQI